MSQQKNIIYILLGANLGKPLEQLNLAKLELENELGELLIISSVYETEAWGVEDQPLYYNQVLKLVTVYDAQQCLAICQSIENKLGRIRLEKWGARIIDIDILYFNDIILDTPNLILPHPFIQERKFALIPLVEIAPDYVHPKLLQSNQNLLIYCKDKLNVHKLN